MAVIERLDGTASADGPAARSGGTAHAEQAISLCCVAVDTRGEGGVAMTLAQEDVFLREAVQQTMELDEV